VHYVLSRESVLHGVRRPPSILQLLEGAQGGV
jgi:hypothetical protein